MIVSVALALVAFGVWFFAFAGLLAPNASPREGVRPSAQNSGVHVIVLGIVPGVANTGYGVVAHQRGRVVALDGGVIETRAGTDAGLRFAHIHAGVGDSSTSTSPTR